MSYEIFGNPVFSKTISRDKFDYLIFYVSFDNHTTRPTRWQYNRFEVFREIFEEFGKNYGKFLGPNDCLSQNETLHPRTAHISFK